MAAVILLLLVLLFLLWFLKSAKKPDGGFGTRVEVPGFEPIPRPVDNFVEPPRQEVVIGVRRNAMGVPTDVDIGRPDLTLGPGEQVAWKDGVSKGNEGGKVEIRLSPNSTPFGGSSFAIARGGVALSGKPVRQPAARASRRYTVFVTTPDGYLLDKTASLTTLGRQTGQGEGQHMNRAMLMDQPISPGGFGERIEDPNFEPIDRPTDNFVEPLRKEVRVSVVRNERGEITDIVVSPDDLPLGRGEQAAWSAGPSSGNEGGKLEILFASNATPFGGGVFVTARGGTALSGAPLAGGVFEYRVLVTTPDGIFQKREANARITVSGF